MSQSFPPKKRAASAHAHDLSLPLSEQAGSSFPGVSQNLFPDVEIIDESNIIFENNCVKHGPMNANLCEKCLANFVYRVQNIDAEQETPLAVQACEFFTMLLNKAAIIVRSPIILEILKLIFKCIVFIGSVLSSCAVCFALMWFVQPSTTPEEERRREEASRRKKAADDAWRARRDADDARKDADQKAWEEKRDADWAARRKEDDDWREEREKYYRDRDAENERRRKEDEEYHKKRTDELLQEAKNVSEKIATTRSNVPEDLKKLDDIGKELKHENPKTDIEGTVSGATKDRQEKEQADAKAAGNRVITIIDNHNWGTNDGSDLRKVEKELDDAERQREDSEDLNKWRKK